MSSLAGFMAQPAPQAPPPPQQPYYPPPQPYSASPPTPPKKSHTALYVVIAVVLVVVVAAIAYAAYAASHATPSNGGSGGGSGGGSNPPAQVTITAVNFDFSGGCWTSSTGTGGTVNAGQSFSTTWTMSYAGGFLQPSSCTINSVSVSTQGFSITSTNTPLTVDAGGTQTLTVVIGTPGAAYTGVVTLNGQVTTA